MTIRCRRCHQPELTPPEIATLRAFVIDMTCLLADSTDEGPHRKKQEAMLRVAAKLIGMRA